MGMTPVEGLLMGTRSGDVDAGIVSFVMEKENIGTQAISTLVNKHSGLLGISGVSSDMREIRAAIAAGNEKAKLAYDMFVYRIKKYIGAYTAALGGADILLFTGGIGENAVYIREQICLDLAFLGIKIDIDKNNQTFGEEAVISLPDSKITIMVVPTDEEFMIASDTMDIVNR